ncbi:MAG: calcium-binding protein, partial [Leptolyngbya sp. SIO1D8]|nr:calcium-binding protein [Leptolyngbya sp. SIO1D8]
MSIPVEWLNEFQVNTGDAEIGRQAEQQIIGLSDGNFLVAWTEAEDGEIGTAPGQDIIGKIYDVEGDLVRDAFVLNSSQTNFERDFDIAPTNDGGFILVYEDDSIPNVNQTTIRWQRHGSDGSVDHSAIIANENQAQYSLGNPQVAVNLTDNTSVVTFSDSFFSFNDIRARAVDATGTLLGNEFDAAQNTLGATYLEADVAILSNGNYVSVARETQGSSHRVEFTIFTSDRILVSNDNVPFFSTAFAPQVTSLVDGGFVVTWVGGSDVKYQIYENTGVERTEVLTAAQGISSTFADPEIVALPDGDFVIVWNDDRAKILEAQRFNGGDGTTEGSVFNVDLLGNVGADAPNIGVTGDGRILFTWSPNVNGSGEVFASIWDPRSSPINANTYDVSRTNFVRSTVITSQATSSTVTGDSSDEILLGQNGDDTLNGEAGNDILDGGAGDDSMNGGDGNDTYIVDSSGDFVTENHDDDFGGTEDTVLASVSYSLAPGTPRNQGYGIENLTLTGSGDINATGNGKDNVITGNSGGNILNGGAGDDTLNGGDGNDTLNGGDGNDILNGGAGDDVLNGDAGDDSLNGGADDDTLS